MEGICGREVAFQCRFFTLRTNYAFPYMRIEPTLRRKQQKLCMKQKTLLIAMLAIVMAACGDKQQEVAPQAYPVVAVEQSAVEITDDYPATIRGRQDIEIYPQVSGKIVEVAVAQARASKLSVEASVLTLKKQIRAQENSLSALLGRMSGHIERSTGSSSPRSLPWECRCICLPFTHRQGGRLCINSPHGAGIVCE